RQLITGSDDHTAAVWDVETGRLLVPSLKEPSTINWLSCSADSRHIATANDCNTARVWSAVTGEPASPVLRHNGAVNTAEFSPDGRQLVTAGNEGIARVWDLSALHRPEEAAVPSVPTPPAATAADRWTSSDGSRCITAERGFMAQVRDPST